MIAPVIVPPKRQGLIKRAVLLVGMALIGAALLFVVWLLDMAGGDD